MMNALFDLSGKMALITGSSQGIGFGIVRGLGQAGATIILNGRNKERLNRAVSTLSSEGLKVFGYSFDVSDSNQIDQKISAIEREVGPIDILVNNAGIQRRGPPYQKDLFEPIEVGVRNQPRPSLWILPGDLRNLFFPIFKKRLDKVFFYS